MGTKTLIALHLVLHIAVLLIGVSAWQFPQAGSFLLKMARVLVILVCFTQYASCVSIGASRAWAVGACAPLVIAYISILDGRVNAALLIAAAICQAVLILALLFLQSKGTGAAIL